MKIIKIVLKYLLSLFMLGAGVNHFLNPDFYVRMMPAYLPWHRELVYASGVFEAAFGVLLLIPRFTRNAAWGIIAALLAVFPANLHMAMNADSYAEVSPAVLWIRLPLQVIFLAWAYWFTRPESAHERRPKAA